MDDLSHQQQDIGMGDKTFVTYLLGFFLCILLTLIPFATVKYAGYNYNKTLIHIYVAAIAQAVIQIVLFLRLNWKTEQAQMNVMGFAYALLLTIVIIGASMWIMWNLNYHMMPMPSMPMHGH